MNDALTYDFEHSSENNFWSILYLTGYLTKERKDNDEITYLKIPNEEVKTIFADTIVEWFKDTMRASDRSDLMNALWNGEDDKASIMISKILRQTISYHNYKEDYYHAFLAGIFIGVGYSVESCPDVVVKDIVNQRVIIIEAKHSKKLSDMQEDCITAVNQIKTREYVEDFLDDYNTVVCYGLWCSIFQKERFRKEN